MKKLIIALGFVAVLGFSGFANAQIGTCNQSGNGYFKYSQAQATALLSGSLACYPTAAPYSNQEAHYATGVVGDYKKGPAGLGVVDPTLLNIGGWAVAGTGLVTYTYSPGAKTFSYFIYGPNVTTPPSGLYDFCTAAGGTAIRIRVAKGSTGPC